MNKEKVVHFTREGRWTGCGRLSSKVFDFTMAAGPDYVTCKRCLDSHMYNDALIEKAETELGIEWTDDCQGKKDYDGDVLHFSTRYWPRGGGFSLTTTNENGVVTVEENEGSPDVKPSAVSSLRLMNGDDNYTQIEELIEQKFEGETFEEVAEQVEAWAQEQMYKVAKALRSVFKERGES